VTRAIPKPSSRATDASDEADREALQLGQKIRSIRMSSGLTLRAVAQAAGVSESLISQIERGLASPSIATLRALASALDVTVAALFLSAGDDEGSSDAELDSERIIVRKHERKSLRLPRSSVTYELLTPDLSRKIEFLWIEYTPGAVSHPQPMSHAGEENALCLEGSVVVTIEGREFTLTAGDSISIDGGRVHKVENRTTVSAVVVSAITPPSF
jgi:transcriptional regulator with XRE-family HTH domain